MSALESWLWRPRADRGITFLDSRGRERRYSYDEIAARAFGAAELVAARRPPQPGGAAVLLTGTGPAYVIGLFAALLLGYSVVPAHPPRFSERRPQYRERIAGILGRVRPELLVVEDRHLDAAAELAGDGPAVVPASALVEGRPGAPSRLGGESPSPHPVLIQFTSGSTSAPRGVALYGEQLEAQLEALFAHLGLGAEACFASWLPLHHDMGLIGMLLTPLVLQSELFMMTPETFALRPSLWLDCFSARGATHAASSPAGLEHCLRRAGAETSLDLSGWRVLVVGAEPVPAGTLREFVATFARSGFDARTLCPAFGLAEATLAATAVPPGVEPRVVGAVDLEPGRRPEPRPLTAAPAPGRELVLLGTPVPGARVEIRTPAGEPARPGQAGDIWVGGASVSPGYVGDAEATAATFRDGWCRTGDTGVLVGDELVFLGRGGDRLSVNGRNFYAEDLEAVLGGLPGVGVGSALALPETAGADQRVTVLWESRLPAREAPEVAAAMAARVAQEVGGEVAIRVLAVDRGAIPRTTSGKVRRRAAAAQLASGDLPGRLLASVR